MTGAFYCEEERREIGSIEVLGLHCYVTLRFDPRMAGDRMSSRALMQQIVATHLKSVLL